MTLTFRPPVSQPESPNGIARRRHPRFYFQDGNVVFLVEYTVYRIHRYFFQRDSSIFEAMFSLPVPAGERPEGESEDNPIYLHGIATQDFDRMLSILYPLNFLEYEMKSVEEWTSVLDLASRWEFSSLHELAVNNLYPITTTADKIYLGHVYEVTEWLVPAYTELCTRPDPLTLEEGRKLGVDIVTAIGQVRHQIRYRSNLNRSHDTIVELVRRAFVSSSGV
ncbi:hypothetical protein K435DRAFT_644623 [Dendrothele bispora CBS 962.96]|uniref:BTB domain-containing protein n=1 Tax=Dendrothele bispora (strain CBS 962.96) TaxID=1314807 RepID=A0A4S8MTU5_DENBC|nr:hypothetical protein K435DRAFT_644623 [Dendrothele bispora CBS 962.96]